MGVERFNVLEHELLPQGEGGSVTAGERIVVLASDYDRDTGALRAEVDRLRGIKPELPPFPPSGEGLPRYGLRWHSQTEPLAVPIADGYWTPWHLAEAELAAVREALDRAHAVLIPMVDVGQRRLNGGPYCIHVEGDGFCGRAKAWEGHKEQFQDWPGHKFVDGEWLYELASAALASAWESVAREFGQHKRGCGGEFIEEPFRNASIPPTTWVTCEKCGKRALKEQP